MTIRRRPGAFGAIDAIRPDVVRLQPEPPASGHCRPMSRTRSGVGFAAIGLLAATQVQGQSPAGVELRDPLEQAIPQTTAPLAEPATAPPVGLARVRVDAFRFRGNRLLDAETLSAAVREYAGRDLTGPDLHAVALALAEAYLRRGHLARVRIHAVSLTEGIADIAVEELRLARVNLFLPENARVDRALAERFLGGRFEAGAPLPLAEIERRVGLLDALPGVAAAVALDPGAGPGEVDLNLRLRDRPLLAGSLGLDNHGLRSAGQQQLTADLRADNGLGLAERFSVLAAKAAGREDLAPTFTVPVGGDGLRAGLGAYGYHYRDRMAGRALGLTGNQAAWSLFADQVLVQRSNGAVTAGVALRHIGYHDDSIFGELRRRRINALDVTLAGRWRTGAGVGAWQVALRHGRADLSGNAGDQAADAASSRIEGHFTRLRWRIGHESPLGGGTLAISLRGQQATRNLDATQDFYLGGPGRVRAYPTAEAIGDEGWLASIEWRRPLDEHFTGRVFADAGGVRRNAKPWADQRNAYGLAGIGAGLSWRMPEGCRADLDLARQVGGNPGRQPNSPDLDGRSDRWRLWLSVARDF